jgi:hypothetical protein
MSKAPPPNILAADMAAAGLQFAQHLSAGRHEKTSAIIANAPSAPDRYYG